jgi:hypothetical protein
MMRDTAWRKEWARYEGDPAKLPELPPGKAERPPVQESPYRLHPIDGLFAADFPASPPFELKLTVIDLKTNQINRLRDGSKVKVRIESSEDIEVEIVWIDSEGIPNWMTSLETVRVFSSEPWESEAMGPIGFSGDGQEQIIVWASKAGLAERTASLHRNGKYERVIHMIDRKFAAGGIHSLLDPKHSIRKTIPIQIIPQDKK